MSTAHEQVPQDLGNTLHKTMESYIDAQLGQYDDGHDVYATIPEHELETAEGVLEGMGVEVERNGDGEIVDVIYHDPFNAGKEISADKVARFRDMVSASRDAYEEQRAAQEAAVEETASDEQNEPVAPVVSLADRRGLHQAIQTGDVRRKRGSRQTASVDTGQTSEQSEDMESQNRTNAPDATDQAILQAPITQAEASQDPVTTPTARPDSSPATLAPPSHEDDADSAERVAQPVAQTEHHESEVEQQESRRGGVRAFVGGMVTAMAVPFKGAAKGTALEGKGGKLRDTASRAFQAGKERLAAAREESTAKERVAKAMAAARERLQAFRAESNEKGKFAAAKELGAKAFWAADKQRRMLGQDIRTYFNDQENGQRRIYAYTLGAVAIVGGVYLARNGFFDSANMAADLNIDTPPAPDAIQAPDNSNVAPEVAPPQAGSVAPETPAAPVPELPAETATGIRLDTPVDPDDRVWEWMMDAGAKPDDIMENLETAADKFHEATGLPVEWHGSGKRRWLEVNGHSDTATVIRLLKPYM